MKLGPFDCIFFGNFDKIQIVIFQDPLKIT